MQSSLIASKSKIWSKSTSAMKHSHFHIRIGWSKALLNIIYFIARRCLSRREAAIQLAFGVMTYERQRNSVMDTIGEFTRLMDQIYEDESNHVYVLHTDVKSSQFLHDHINNFCNPKLNCISINPRSVTWGGISVTEMNLALMQAADDFDSKEIKLAAWEYFILLGHETIPLTTLTYTEQFLLSYPKGTNFINCWRASGYDFFGQWENLDYRLARVVVDLSNENILYETDIERSVPKGLEIYKSIQYVVLSRDFVRYV